MTDRHPRRACGAGGTLALLLLVTSPVDAQLRPEAAGLNGAVVAGHPLAATAGAAVIQQGGNAVDAAITMAGVLSVVRPHMNGVGGDAFMLIYDAATKKVYALNGSGRAGTHATPELFAERGLDAVPTYGILTATVPGAVRAWEDALRRFGTLSLADALQPAIGYAERGFPLTSKLHADLEGLVDRVAEDAELARIYLRDGELLKLGDIVIQRDLAGTLRRIAEEGADGFYRGETAARITAFMDRDRGLVTAEDLARHTSTWTDPLSTTYRGHRVLAMPPNSQGLALLMLLNAVEQQDLANMGHNSANYIHTFVEVKKAVFADRDRYITDPEFADVPVQRLISKEYAAELSRRITETTARQTSLHITAPSLPPRSPDSTMQWEGDTVYLCAVDGDGNAVVLIESLFNFLGSGRMVPGTGILLQNRGSSFTLDTTKVNVVAPHKRPYHTLTPHMVLNPDGTPFILMGTPGGDGQTQTLIQVFHNVLTFGMTPQAAVEAPRWRSHEDLSLAVEPGVSEQVRYELKRRGHTVVVRPPSSEFGGAQMILIDPVTGARITGADMRREGTAIAW